MTKKNYIFLLALVFLSFDSPVDSWLPPKTTDYYNDRKTYFVRVVPMKRPKKYLEWKSASPEEKKNFAPADTTIIPCHAMLYRRTAIGKNLIWKKNLVNPVCPVGAMVSADARYVVTFDDWANVGYGDAVMVYYDARGKIIKNHTLEEISPFPIDDYPASVSSLWWRRDARFVDNKRIEIAFSTRAGTILKKTYNLEEGRIE